MLEASDSIASQSHANPDGTGLGTFDRSGRPVVEKQPLAAWNDPAFAAEARERRSTTFLAHVRHTSGSVVSAANTHPFEMDNRLFAHNGVVEGLDALEQRLGRDLARLAGDTDSERVFARVTREIARTGGVAAGLTAALRWVADELPLYAVNLVLTTATDLWALRYPDTHDLLLLERDRGAGTLEHHSRAGTRVWSGESPPPSRPSSRDPSIAGRPTGSTDAAERGHSRRAVYCQPVVPEVFDGATRGGRRRCGATACGRWRCGRT